MRKIAPAIPSDNLRPVLENFLIKEGRISATNLRLFISDEIGSDETMLLPFKPVQNILGAIFEQEISIEQTGKELILKAGYDTFKLGKAGDLADYPVALYEDEPIAKLNSGGSFFASVQSAAKHQATDSKLTIHGVNVRAAGRYIEIAGTDGKTIYLARYNNQANLKFDAHVTNDFISSIAGWSATDISIGARNIKCVSGTTTVVSQLLETVYPDYAPFMPEGVVANCVVMRKDLETALKKCTVFNSGSLEPVVRANFSKANEITFSYSNTEFEQQSVTSIPAEQTIGVREFSLLASILQRSISSLPDSADRIHFHIPQEVGKPAYIIYQNILILLMPFAG